ncbi:MAG: SLBB domain-containing protein [Candidatus Eisenbacteria bacterium]|nr:SLBB domain-containing protein [Candidatus Eisenbacteria bacterium]
MKMRLSLLVALPIVFSVLTAFLFLAVSLGEAQSRAPDVFQIDTPEVRNQLISPRTIGPKAVIEEGMLLQDGPIDASQYMVGPGDVFVVNVWGKASLQLRLEVDTEGKIFVPDSGSLLVGNKSLEEARNLIRSMVLSAIPQGNVEIRLAVLRKFKVHVSGEIESPGSYVASQVTRVSEIISIAAGDTVDPGFEQTSTFRDVAPSDLTVPRPREISSLRNIELRRRNGETERVDLVLFFVTGDLSRNPCVRDGDIIYVPKSERFFSVGGAVMFPGTYELVQGERLSQILKLVGGVTPGADLDKGELRRFVSDDKAESNFFDVQSVILGTTDFEIRDGDRIYVRSPAHYLEREQVLVRGEVQFPGWYAINPREDKLSEVVLRAGGLTAEADLSGGRVIRPRSLASGTQGVVQCDMVKLFVEKRAERDVVLESGDVIEIPKKVGYVYVTGEVRRPGYVCYVQDKRAGFYIHEAGGFTRRADGGKTLVTRLSTGQSLSSREAGIVLSNDSINVPVRAEGARWTIVKDTISLLAELATIYIVIDQATR